MSTFKRVLAQVVFVLIVLGLASSASAQSPDATATAAKVAQLLNGTGYTYVQRTPTVWYIVMNRSSLKDFKLILASSDNLVVIFVTVLKKQQMQMTPEFMLSELQNNDKFDYVKIGIDKDGDLFVRTDCTPRVMDAQELKSQIDQVAAASNEVYANAQPFLAK
jgi:hypothetical protein